MVFKLYIYKLYYAFYYISLSVSMCEGPFLDNVQAQIEARTLSLLVVVLRDWAWAAICDLTIIYID